MRKLKKLKKILRQMRSLLVAYSGGVDSTFLLKVGGDCLGKKIVAVTAYSPTYTHQELAFAKKTARSFGIEHRTIHTDEFKDRHFASNPKNRCYYCKKELFLRLHKIASSKKLNFVADASTISDESDYRPGARAKRELKVRSPLQEAGFIKEDVRKYSRQLGLVTWNMPAGACLASRIPYGTRIKPEVLRRIERSERFLKSLGFPEVRLRHYQASCRIEVPHKDIPRLIGQRERVSRRLKNLGYSYVTVDLEGYRTGSMNEMRPRLTERK